MPIHWRLTFCAATSAVPQQQFKSPERQRELFLATKPWVMSEGFEDKLHIFPFPTAAAVNCRIKMLRVAIQYLETCIEKGIDFTVSKRVIFFKGFLPA